MHSSRLVLACLAGGCLALAQTPSAAPQLTDAEQEQFLSTAKILNRKPASKGITGTLRVTLSDGKITHDAHVQAVNISKSEFRTDRGVELNFRDSYKYNIAAYKLARMLGIRNVPVSVERKVDGKTSAITWWVDDVLMDEQSRKAQKLEAPNPERWSDQMFVLRVFDQLIYNADRNLGNVLILKNWDMVMIDHTRSFRLPHTLRNVKDLSTPRPWCERTLLKNMRALDKDKVMEELRPWCTKSEVDAVMARRDIIVKFFDAQVKERGEAAVLYDLPQGIHILPVAK